MSCGICNRIQDIKDNTNPHFIAELQTSFAVLGDHQFYHGYSLLLLKDHQPELHDLRHAKKMEFLEEMSIVAECIYRSFNPKKLNYELLGNGMSHMHWHIFPRYSDDLEPLEPVWCIDKSIRYAEAAVPSTELRVALKREVLRQLHLLAPDRIIRSFE